MPKWLTGSDILKGKISLYWCIKFPVGQLIGLNVGFNMKLDFLLHVFNLLYILHVYINIKSACEPYQDDREFNI